MSNQDVIARLARACAHGHRQLEFVNELLADEGYMKMVQIPTVYGLGAQYGDARLGGNSFRNLKKRLISNGFMIKASDFDKNQRRELRLKFSV